MSPKSLFPHLTGLTYLVLALSSLPHQCSKENNETEHRTSHLHGTGLSCALESKAKIALESWSTTTGMLRDGINCEIGCIIASGPIIDATIMVVCTV